MTNILINADSVSTTVLKKGSVNCTITSPGYWKMRDYATDDDQVGHEETADCLAWARKEPPCDDCYVCAIRKSAEMIRYAMHPSGTLWLNLDDTYRDKQSLGIPFVVAKALQADGWWWRGTLPWFKTSTLPNTANDRPTIYHEYVLLLTPSVNYFYDRYAVMRTKRTGKLKRNWRSTDVFFDSMKYIGAQYGMLVGDTGNPLALYVNPDNTFKTDHSATFPPRLTTDMIRSGTSEKGVCPECRSPWIRQVERIDHGFEDRTFRSPHRTNTAGMNNGSGATTLSRNLEYTTTGWDPSCGCGHDPVPAIVLDPFVGTGSTLEECRRLGRSGIGIDLSYHYLLEDASRRLGLDNRTKINENIVRQDEFKNLPLFIS